MMRSLFSGISGLRNHQTRMDVIGNNIANVNTAGYKASRVVFQDIFSQNLAAGMAGTGVAGAGGQGGTNPIQVGLGISLATIDVLHSRSAFQRTDRATDMMINGDGFFVVRSPDGDFFTRAGNFTIDNEGYLVNPQGFFVMGYQVPTEMGIVDHGRPAIEPIPTAAQLAAGAGGTWVTTAGDPTATPPTVDVVTIPAGQTIPAGFFRTGDTVPWGSLTVNGVPWPVEPTPAPDPNPGGIVVRSGEIVPSQPTMSAIGIVVSGPDSVIRRSFGIGALQNAAAAVPPTFGLVPAGDPETAVLSPIRMIRPDTRVLPQPLGIEILSQITADMYSFVDGEWVLNEDFDLDAFLDQFPLDDVHLPGFGVSSNGDVSAIINNRNVVIARLAVAMFANPAGLEIAGNNLLRETASSGEVVMGEAGFDGAGQINGGGLEMSNVDLSDQFTDMIVTQRGFQANSRIITVTDSMLEELVNLKR